MSEKYVLRWVVGDDDDWDVKFTDGYMTEDEAKTKLYELRKYARELGVGFLQGPDLLVETEFQPSIPIAPTMTAGGGCYGNYPPSSY
jgi:hypothetical protein